MNQQAFFEYLEAYWKLVAQTEASEAKLVLDMLRAIRESAPSIGKSPSATREVLREGQLIEEPFPSGYLPRQRLLWIRRRTLTTLAYGVSKNKNGTATSRFDAKFVREDQPFIHRTTEFVTSGAFADLQARAYAPLLESTPSFSLSDCGAVLVGKSDYRKDGEVLWIGVTTETAIGDLPIEERGARLRAVMRDFPALAPHAWANAPSVRATIADSATATFFAWSRDLLPRITSRQARDLHPNYFLLEEAEEPWLVWLAPMLPPMALDDLKAFVSEYAPQELMIVSPLSPAETRRELEMFAKEEELDGLPCTIFTRESLVRGLSHYPEQWSAQAPHTGFAVRRVANNEELKDTLLTSPLRSQIPVVDDVARNLPHSQGNICITGRPGSGKTTALYHLLRSDFADALLITVYPHAQAEDLTTIRDLMRDARELGFARVVLAIDDLHRHQEDVLRRLLGSQSDTSLTVIVTYWPTEEDRIAERFGPWIADWQRINLDSPDPVFIRKLVHHCEALVRLGAPADHLVDLFTRRASTPHAIITTLTHQLSKVYRSTFWQSEYARLTRRRAHGERHVLIALAFLREVGVPTRRDTLATVLPDPRLDDYLVTLATSGWLVAQREELWIDDAQLVPAEKELWEDERPTKRYSELMVRVLEGALPRALQAIVLRASWGVFAGTPDHLMDLRILSALVEASSDSDSTLGWAALSLIAYDADAGDEGMRRYFTAHPDDVDRWHDWVDAHERRRDAERSVSVLEAGLRATEGSPDDTLIETAAFLADTGTHGDLVLAMLRRLANTRAGERVREAIQNSGHTLAQLRLQRL